MTVGTIEEYLRIMTERLKKIAGWCPGPELYAAGAVAALLLLLIPLVRLALYSVPWYDDYNYGRFAKIAMENAPTLQNAVKGALECVRVSWYAWQGTYSSVLLMSLMPGIWGEEYYCLGPVFLILLLTVSVCVLVSTLLKNILKAERSHIVGLSAVSAIMTVVLIHTAQAGFYWYNGGVHYVGIHAFAMLLTAVTVKLFYEEQMWRRCLWTILGILLAALVAGGNFVTALQGLLVLLSIVALGCIPHKGRTFFLLPVLAAYAWGFYKNVSAPGNDKRAANFVDWGMSPAKSVLYSFVEGGRKAWEFTGWMTLVLLVLMLPLILHMVRRTTFEFKKPWLVSLWSVCLYATGFTPSLYSLGHGGLGRTLNAVKLTWQLLLILNLIYWCGWLCRRLKLRGENSGQMWCWWFYPLTALMILLVFWTEPNQAGSFSSYGAYYYIHTGEAYNFYQEYLERVEILKSDESYVELTPYRWRPWFICMGDLSGNPEDESNRALAAWYGKAEIICVDDNE